MRTYRTYKYTNRRLGVKLAKPITKPMKVDGNRPVDTMHGILLGVAILVAAVVVAVPHG
jgi:hypothetical protein